MCRCLQWKGCVSYDRAKLHSASHSKIMNIIHQYLYPGKRPFPTLSLPRWCDSKWCLSTSNHRAKLLIPVNKNTIIIALIGRNRINHNCNNNRNSNITSNRCIINASKTIRSTSDLAGSFTRTRYQLSPPCPNSGIGSSQPGKPITAATTIDAAMTRHHKHWER